ncbi:MAG: Uma2 family endonuclease [Geminicoccaceae bacterium]
MAEPAEKRWTVEEFLAWDDGTDRRYELIRGEIVEIALQPEAHGATMGSLGALLHDGLERPCRALIRGGVLPPDREDTYYQADLLVTCAPPERGRQYPPAPVLIAEVVSESTAILDHGRKLDDYRQLSSVKEILLVASEERRVQHWRRDGARWVVDDLIGDADLRLATVADAIPLGTIYEGSGV